MTSYYETCTRVFHWISIMRNTLLSSWTFINQLVSFLKLVILQMQFSVYLKAANSMFIVRLVISEIFWGLRFYLLQCFEGKFLQFLYSETLFECLHHTFVLIWTTLDFTHGKNKFLKQKWKSIRNEFVPNVKPCIKKRKPTKAARKEILEKKYLNNKEEEQNEIEVV